MYYIENNGAGIKLGAILFDFLSSYEENFRELVFVCIGSDRITGDSLGPLVGPGRDCPLHMCMGLYPIQSMP